MSFKNLVKVVREMQDKFTVDIPDASGGSFIAHFKLLTGNEALWNFRLNPSKEYESSFTFQFDLRSFVSSLIKFEEAGETDLYPFNILSVLFELDHPEYLKSPVEFVLGQQEAATVLLYQGYWEQIRACKSEADYDSLQLPVKEFLWDLLYKAFLEFFEPDYLLVMTERYNYAYRTNRPNIFANHLKTSLKNLLDAQNALKEETSDAPKADTD
jgi:hypothetical protein